MIDFRLLEQLADLLKRSDAASIEIRKRWWGTSVKISRVPEGSGPVTYQMTGLGAPPMHAAAPPPAPAAAPAAAAEPSRPQVQLQDIKSPMVGTFYAQPEPGADPYVREGTRIQPGQTLCIIEAMKIMNPLDAEVSGVIREVCVEDAQPVEFGQVLFRVDPNG